MGPLLSAPLHSESDEKSEKERKNFVFLINYAKMVKVMSSVINFCFFNAEFSIVDHPLVFFSSATTSKSISKI